MFPSLLFDLRPNYGEVNEVMVTPSKGFMPVQLYSLLQTMQQATVDPHLCQRLLDTHTKSGSVSCGETAPFSWALVHTRFVFFLFF